MSPFHILKKRRDHRERLSSHKFAKIIRMALWVVSWQALVEEEGYCICVWLSFTWVFYAHHSLNTNLPPIKMGNGTWKKMSHYLYLALILSANPDIFQIQTGRTSCSLTLLTTSCSDRKSKPAQIFQTDCSWDLDKRGINVGTSVLRALRSETKMFVFALLRTLLAKI
jgi:hypothetical protein